jgi:hypothetical protein
VGQLKLLAMLSILLELKLSDQSHPKRVHKALAWLQETSYACITEQVELSSYQEACHSMDFIG